MDLNTNYRGMVRVNNSPSTTGNVEITITNENAIEHDNGTSHNRAPIAPSQQRLSEPHDNIERVASPLSMRTAFLMEKEAIGIDRCITRFKEMLYSYKELLADANEANMPQEINKYDKRVTQLSKLIDVAKNIAGAFIWASEAISDPYKYEASTFKNKGHIVENLSVIMRSLFDDFNKITSSVNFPQLDDEICKFRSYERLLKEEAEKILIKGSANEIKNAEYEEPYSVSSSYEEEEEEEEYEEEYESSSLEDVSSEESSEIEPYSPAEDITMVDDAKIRAEQESLESEESSEEISEFFPVGDKRPLHSDVKPIASDENSTKESNATLKDRNQSNVQPNYGNSSTELINPSNVVITNDKIEQ